MHPENYEKSLRHAHAAIEHGPGEAMALALAGVTIGMMEHDRKLADQVFERALALSASCAFVYSFGYAPVAYGGDAAHAIDWGERAIRLSPSDAMDYIPQGVIGFGNFQLGRHEGAVAADRRVVQLNPGFSILYGWLSAPLAKLGRLDEAKVAGARLLALDPGFSISGCSAAVGIAPEIADTVANAMRLPACRNCRPAHKQAVCASL
jgi:tetratricopeptide (TPR) repeat protein